MLEVNSTEISRLLTSREIPQLCLQICEYFLTEYIDTLDPSTDCGPRFRYLLSSIAKDMFILLRLTKNSLPSPRDLEPILVSLVRYTRRWDEDIMDISTCEFDSDDDITHIHPVTVMQFLLLLLKESTRASLTLVPAGSLQTSN